MDQQPEKFCIHEEAKAGLVMVLCNLCEQEWKGNGRFKNTDWYINLTSFKTATEAKEKAADISKKMKLTRVNDCRHCNG
jgi:hypothetical protein